MRAAFLTGPQRIEIKDVREPETPKDGVKIKVEACAVCGSDLRRWKEGPAPGSADNVPGHEAAGTVIEAGPEITKYKIGDRIALGPDVHCDNCYYCHRGMYNLCENLYLVGITPGYPGGFAEKMIITSEVINRGICHPIPDDLSMEHAALAEPCSSVLASHEKAGTSLGDTVVIIGAGPTGCISIAVAKSRGAEVIVSELSEKRRQLAAAFQPDLIVDPAEDDIIDRVKDLTNGLGASVVICHNPIAKTQAKAIAMTRKGGKILLFGGLPKADPSTTLDGNDIHYGEKQVIGTFSYHPTHHEAALTLLKKNTIPGQHLVNEILPLDDIQKAYETAASGKVLKVIVKP